MLKENIKKLRKANCMTLEQVADYIGVKKSTLQRYESGVISNIPSEKIEKLSECFDVSPSVLMGWDVIDNTGGRAISGMTIDSQDKKYTLQSAVQKEISIFSTCRSLPKINELVPWGCGDLITTIPNPYDSFEGVLHGMEIKDDSMNLIIPKGTYAIINSSFSKEIRDGAILSISINGQNSILRKYFKIDNMIILKPESYDPSYQPITFVGEQRKNIYIIGEMIGFVSPLLVGIESGT
ncbi:XRE family transcriptional regulator [Turicibacter sanguinis]|uniref:XRE family transcriptional regulator n=1 Tax=Turicibacter sanguinis TaxID=154288 RepID=UPI0012BBB100|nr:LexA family transcriptional regulator [Turicibacter sanguinis]MDB8437285.1 LexA family transcriptional regulator [Turicibacter sanguinis]MTO22768.1 helix-turn-helix domain-containing protein [Turicibacter sanguinis]MTO25903.1 helix-turn-helix domain-containing protein [Turicibacter sanguinis]MTO88809.1 helix-turn-helix domain-containing protein [Turicibacter sanguinis]MTP68747.1 helix-turn-helix domain-containing protein [Turicibacter sanguinis]